jgi:hypothetical protein
MRPLKRYGHLSILNTTCKNDGRRPWYMPIMIQRVLLQPRVRAQFMLQYELLAWIGSAPCNRLLLHEVS